MYVALGKEIVIDSKNIIGIFDLDITSQSYLTRKYLKMAEKSGLVSNAAGDLPKSFVVMNKKLRNKVYLSQMSTATLYRHIENGII